MAVDFSYLVDTSSSTPSSSSLAHETDSSLGETSETGFSVKIESPEGLSPETWFGYKLDTSVGLLFGLNGVYPEFFDGSIVYEPALVVTVLLSPEFFDGSTVYEPALFLVLTPEFFDGSVVYEPTLLLSQNITPEFFDGSLVYQPTINAPFVVKSLLTQRGPLVKGWGDWTPATKNDVKVFIDSVEVDVADVNPYHGEIFLVTPVTPSASLDVRVDYKWFQTPIMAMRLNTKGLGLNKADHRRGAGQFYGPGPTYDITGHGDQVQDATHPKGAVRTKSRFPFTVALSGPLAPHNRPKPLLIGHRYAGFEKAYSAVLNSPTSLRLNNPPNRIAKQDSRRNPVGVAEVFEGTDVPNPFWSLEGQDAGYVNLNQGTYTVVDNRSDSFDPEDPSVALYWRAADFTFPSSAYVVGRFQIEDAASLLNVGNTNLLSPDGVFTGVGFGVHNNLRMWLAGALLVNGLEHVGLLLDSHRPEKVTSWKIGPTSTVTIKAKTSMSVQTDQMPLDIRDGHRFQILTGTQAGVYTATHVVFQSDGTTTVTVSPAFPADFTKYGNQYPEIVWETLWSENPSTYRLEVAPDRNLAVLKVSGATSGTVVNMDNVAPLLAEGALISQTAVSNILAGTSIGFGAGRVEYQAVPEGLSGNGVTVSQIDPGVAQAETQVSVSGKNITVSLAREEDTLGTKASLVIGTNGAVRVQSDVRFESMRIRTVDPGPLGNLAIAATLDGTDITVTLARTADVPFVPDSLHVGLFGPSGFTLRSKTDFPTNTSLVLINPGVATPTTTVTWIGPWTTVPPPGTSTISVTLAHNGIGIIATVLDVLNAIAAAPVGINFEVIPDVLPGAGVVAALPLTPLAGYTPTVPGALTSTANDVALVLNSHLVISTMLDASALGTGLGIISPQNWVTLTSGDDEYLNLGDSAFSAQASSIGVDGNLIQIETIDPGGLFSSLFVTVLGNTISVNLGRAFGVLISTSADVAFALNNDLTARDMVDVVPLGTGLGIVAAESLTFLTGGSDFEVGALLSTGKQVKEAIEANAAASALVSVNVPLPGLAQVGTKTLAGGRGISTEGTGQVFWGSLSAKATNRTSWSFFRYGLVPDFGFLRSASQTIAAEMAILPESEVYNPWFVTQQFGYSTAGSSLVLKSTSNHPTLNFSFGYERIEPFFVPQAYLDVQAKIQVDSGVLGSGDAQIVLRDTLREVRLGTLLYVEQGSGINYRRLITLPSTSFAGLLSPENQGWEISPVSTVSVENIGPVLRITQEDGQQGGYEKFLDLAGLTFTPSDGRIFEARLAVLDYTDVLGETGVVFYAQVGGPLPANQRFIGVRLWAGGSPSVRLIDGTLTSQQSYPFDWTDGLPHTYRVVADADAGTVSLFVDEVLQLPTKNMTDFVGGAADNTVCVFGIGPGTAGVTSVTEWYSVSCQAIPPLTAKRTLGVWRGGDPTSINSWEIPRTDTSEAPNSLQTGPVVQEMDWRSPIELRVFRSPDWGVTVYRPDLPLPPYYTPEVAGTPGTGFATQTTEPSAGWINVETANLPRVASLFGSVSFGALDPQALTQQHWSWMRYRLYRPPTANHLAPQGMVLNRANVITSGELNRDITLETIVVPVQDAKSVNIWIAHYRAKEVYKIIDGTTAYVRDSWTFDQSSQVVTLNDGLEFQAASVTVIFVPGKPTTTYLRNQPVLDGVTQLNENTPPVPKGQTVEASHAMQAIAAPTVIPDRVTLAAYSPNDPTGIPDSTAYAAADTNTFADFVSSAAALYEKMTFIEVPDGGEKGLIAPFSDLDGMLPEGYSGYSVNGTEPIYSLTGGGPSLGGVGDSAGLNETGSVVGTAIGAHVFAMQGAKFSDRYQAPPIPYEQNGGGAGRFLFLGGGSGYLGPVLNGSNLIIGLTPLGGLLGPATMLFYPTHPSVRQLSMQTDLGMYTETLGPIVDDPPIIETLTGVYSSVDSIGGSVTSGSMRALGVLSGNIVGGSVTSGAIRALGVLSGNVIGGSVSSGSLE